MASLRKLPVAVVVAALAATLVGCGSSEIRDERDEARMERDAALAALAAAEQARMAAEAAKAAFDSTAAEDDAAWIEAALQLDALQAEKDQRAADQMAQDMAARETMSRVLYGALGSAGKVGTTLEDFDVDTNSDGTDNVHAGVKGIRWDVNDDTDPNDDGTAEDDIVLSRTTTEATMLGSWTGAEYQRVVLQPGANPRVDPDVTHTAMVYTNPGKYLVYGWWLRDSVEVGTQIGTFTDTIPNRAVVALTANGFPTLQGSATYMGHAAGQYALLPGLANPTGDAGHFTANVKLEADWSGDATGGTLSGTVDGFMGADGMPRDWTVALPSTSLSTSASADGAGVGATDADLSDTDNTATGGIDSRGQQTNPTTWTIGGVPTSPAGMWHGQLRGALITGRIGTPAVVVGEFTAEYATVVGRMVGAFGAELQPPESR